MPDNPVPLHERILGDGPPVVLLHGLFGSNENLGAIARHLQHSYRVHALDLRNHGRSPHTAEHRYTDLATDVLAHLDGIGSDPVHVVGHSMGGKAAMQLALDAPARIASLTVIDIAPKPYPRHHDAILDAMKALADTPPSSRQEADARLSPAVPEPPIRQFLLKNLQRDAEGAYRLRLNIETLYQRYDDIATWDTRDTNCQAPALFLVGGASDYVTEADRSTITGYFPNAAARVVPDASHWVHAEKPALVGGIIERFIATAGHA